MQDVTSPISIPSLIVGICWIFLLFLTLSNISFFTRWVQTDHPQPSPAAHVKTLQVFLSTFRGVQVF